MERRKDGGKDGHVSKSSGVQCVPKIVQIWHRKVAIHTYQCVDLEVSRHKIPVSHKACQ